MDTKHLISLISNLHIKQLDEIAIQILHGLKSPESEVEKAWINEVERRAREVDSGEVEMIPGDQAMQRLRAITRK